MRLYGVYMRLYGVYMACYGGVYRGLYGHGLRLGVRVWRVGVACVVGCVYGVDPLGVWRAMAWPIGRLWRICRVGIGVVVACVWRVQALGVRCAGVCMALCRRVWVRCTVLWRWVYVWCTLCMCRVVYVWCTLCVRCVYRSMT